MSIRQDISSLVDSFESFVNLLIVSQDPDKEELHKARKYLISDLDDLVQSIIKEIKSDD